jgi:phosphoenolpyruvate synthase/pyruvate phosphate dikinase
MPEQPAHDVGVVLDGSAAVQGLGGKGASLDRLIGWGFPVPVTAVVRAEVDPALRPGGSLAGLLGRLGDGDDVTASEVDEAFLAVPFADDEAQAVVALAQRVGGGARLAVRSSSTSEDGVGRSFAGQHRSLLDVDPGDPAALLRAVRLVQASRWHAAPRVYLRRFGVDGASAAMAVVLMRMVPARLAGVAFTADPVTGSRGDPTGVRVEWVEGLGASLASGTVVPATAVVARRGSLEALPKGVAQAVQLALQVEERAGEPQDVEWAWDGRQVWLVQARPVTAGGAHAGREDVAGAAAGVAGGTVLVGQAASGGRFRGRAQAVASPEDALEPGAVLVAATTEPSWTPLLARAGAVVVEGGGQLSHAAIVARELGIPAVVQVAGARASLAGLDVTVDGDGGVVVIHDAEGGADGPGRSGGG